MAGTKYSAEAMGFVIFSAFALADFVGQSKDRKKKDESVGERSAAGEA
jgi:hypothetical protein